MLKCIKFEISNSIKNRNCTYLAQYSGVAPIGTMKKQITFFNYLPCLYNISLTADVKCCMMLYVCSIANCYQFLSKVIVGESTDM